ncbi:MAG: glutathione S-transferase N-terminal domain-containing protein [Burkholderiales bacterium]|nr:glutathione S-transferase N-terminal domain-containing protein [Burkholderiales bacterium]
MMQLYFSPGTASLAPHFLLEELSLPFELVLVDTDKKEHQQEAYLKLNPKGKIPLLVDGDLYLTESAAICLYLADNYAKDTEHQHFSAALGSGSRAHLYKWMLYLSNTLQAELMTYFYPERQLEAPELAAQLKTSAENRVAGMLNFIDDSLSKSEGEFLLGEHLSVADLFMFMLGRWTRGMHKPARAYPHLGPYMDNLYQRSSIQRAFKNEGLSAPFY